MRRLARTMRSAGRLARLLVLLVGVPVALVVFVGWPLPRRWPDHDVVQRWSADPFTADTVLRLAACLAWLLWILFAYLVVADVLGRVSRIRLPRLRLPNPLQIGVAGLVGATVVPAPVAAHASPRSSPVAAAPALPAQAASPLKKPGDHTVTFVVRGQRYHVLVAKGDTMSKIARQWLGDPDRWPEICALNLHNHFPKVGGRLDDCDLIYPRWDLRLPLDAKPPTGARRVDTPATPPPTPPVPQSTGPAPSPSLPTSGPTTPVDVPGTAASASHEHGVQLPGGWLPWSVAAGMLALYAAMLLRRRARPQPPIGLPVLIRQITRAEQSRVDLDEIDEVQTAAPSSERGPSRADAGDATLDPHRALLEQTAATANPPAIGPVDDQVLTTSQLPRRGVGLAGPGAASAARGIVAALLSTGHLDNRDDVAQVLTTADVMSRLGVPAVQLEQFTISANLADVLHRAQVEVHSRYQEGLPPSGLPGSASALVMVVPTPDGEDAIRLAALADLGQPHNVHAVVLGAWPEGTTWTVDTDGHTRTDDGDVGLRMSCLDKELFGELVAIAAERERPLSEDHSPVSTPPVAREATRAMFRLDVLGDVRLTGLDGGASRIVRSGTKQIAVLLALHPDGYERDDLLEHVFGHVRRKTAPGSLNTCLSELRGLLRHPVTGDSGLLTVGSRCRLDPTIVDTDWWEFHRLLDAGDITAALQLERGSLAGDQPWDSLTEHREYVRAHLARARTRREELLPKTPRGQAA